MKCSCRLPIGFTTSTLYNFGRKESAISKLERRTDMYVSTLERFIDAMGDDLRFGQCFRLARFELRSLK
jgi:hypothetical protein